jgi:hypothetical protein
MRVVGSYEPTCPRLSELREGQVVVGCCGRCQTVGEVNTANWRKTPREAEGPLAVLQLNLECMCGCREVTVQVWPCPPLSPPDRSRFYRWR